MAKVYLVPTEEATYKGVVSDSVPDKGIYLVDEGEYPVKIKYKRHNEKMKEETRVIVAGNVFELNEWLHFLGATRNTIVSMWDYKGEASEELMALFHRCTERKAEIFKEEYSVAH